VFDWRTGKPIPRYRCTNRTACLAAQLAGQSHCEICGAPGAVQHFYRGRWSEYVSVWECPDELACNARAEAQDGDRR